MIPGNGIIWLALDERGTIRKLIINRAEAADYENRGFTIEPVTLPDANTTRFRQEVRRTPMRPPRGVIYLAIDPWGTTRKVIDRRWEYFEEVIKDYLERGWEIEGPYVPGRTPNPMSPRAIRDRLNGFRKD